MKRFIRTLLLGILAGIAIALGGLASLAAKSLPDTTLGPILGAFIFPTGLITVCVIGFFLYTGKIGYAIDEKPKYLLDLLAGYIGNFIGAEFIGYICYAIPAFRNGSIGALAYNYSSTKAETPLLTSFLLAIICGMFVFIAVDIYKRKGGVLGAIGILLPTAAFVLIGAEHCIANMFYFSAANALNLNLALNILVVTIGNSLGALILRGLIKGAEKLIDKPNA